MLQLYKLLVILIIVIIVYIEPLVKRRRVCSTDDVQTRPTSPAATHHIKNNASHGRHKRETYPKSLVFYFENRDQLKKQFADFFEELHKKLLLHSCPDTAKMTDTERLGECMMATIEQQIYNIYNTERTKLEKEVSLGKLPSFLKKLNPDGHQEMVKGDFPIFHKVLKYRYFKNFDKFHLNFFHYLPLIIKNEIRHYYMYKWEGGYDVHIHERIFYLEEKVDEWILKCANHTRMGSLGQDALYEEEFLHELSPCVGEPHLLYEVTTMEDKFNSKGENITLFYDTE